MKRIGPHNYVCMCIYPEAWLYFSTFSSKWWAK